MYNFLSKPKNNKLFSLKQALLLFSVLFIFSCDSSTDTGINAASDMPWISVKGNSFVTENNKAITFSGLNASDPDKLEKEGQWTQAYFKQVKSWNTNVVRLPIHPRAWRERGKENYLKLLDKGIEMAKKEGLYVILDWHSIGNLKDELFQDDMYVTSKKESFEFWAEMAKRYGQNPTVAFFELFNEPTIAGGKHGSCTWSEWKSIMEELIAHIRKTGAKNIPLVAGFNWAYDLRDVMEQPIAAEGIGYISHPYPQKRSKPWEDKWTEDFGHVAEKYPLFLTELGYCEEGDEGAHIPVISDSTYVTTILDYSKRKSISYCVWVFDPVWSPMLIKNWNYELTEPGKHWKKKMTQ